LVGDVSLTGATTSALKSLCIVAAATLIAEVVVMLVLAQLPALSTPAEAIVDASLLLLLLVPALYVFVYRPAEQRLRERDRAALELQAAHDRLESEVAARTRELSEANTRLEATVQEVVARNRETSLLAEMTDLLQACRESDEAYPLVTRFVARIFPAASGVLFVFKASRNVVEPVAHWGLTPAHTNVFTPDDCWALRRGRVHSVAPTANTSRCQHMEAWTSGVSLCIPLMAQSDALGVLMLHHSSATEAGPAAAHRRALAVNTAEHIALALSNLRLRESLRNQAIRDALTGLFNRRYLEETLERELRRAERRSLPLAVVMLDIDHFKLFNDTHGHDAGDVVLRAIGAYLSTHLRPEDIACRYGGEEFTLILPDTPTETGVQRADELRCGVAQLAVQHHDVTLAAVTLSMGIAMFPEHGSTPDTLLRSADQALYRAKDAGRNRVVCAEHTA
jgi:diguanylate cyclase (GGDEF)-like protein